MIKFISTWIPKSEVMLNKYVMFFGRKAHDIRDGIIGWIEDWLTDRRQRVVVDGEVSNWKSVLSGISIWTFIILNIYINDLDNKITINVLKCLRMTQKCLERLTMIVKNNIYKTI